VGIRGNFEAARRRVMGSWSRGGGRRLCRGEVGCRVELKNSVGMFETDFYISLYRKKQTESKCSISLIQHTISFVNFLTNVY